MKEPIKANKNVLELIGATAVISLITSFFISSTGILKVSDTTYRYFIPLSYFIAFGVNLSQAIYLRNAGNLQFKQRSLRLFTFSFTCFVIGSYFLYESNYNMLSVEMKFIERYLIVGLVLVLGYVVLSEYRDQELIIEKIPLTEYHRPPHIGRLVSGVVFGIDLKKAEKLYLKRAEEGSKQTLVSEWRVAMIQTLKSKGALYLQSKGDEIFAMIDEAKYRNANLMAALILRDLKEESIKFRERKIESNELKDEELNFDFRAAIVKGSLRPVFDTVDGKEYPEWEEAGDTMPFVDCGRLMALEKELVAHKNETQVVFEKDLAKDLSKDSMFDQQITYYDRDFRLKAHGKAYQIASLLIDEESLTNQSSTKKAS